MRIEHKFVDIIPNNLEEGKLYITLKYNTALHKCVCGCGEEVVTPLSVTDWKMIYNGESVSLEPSIGNWSFKCSSHYWIKNNEVIWAGKWTEEEINNGRRKDRQVKEKIYSKKSNSLISLLSKIFKK